MDYQTSNNSQDPASHIVDSSYMGNKNMDMGNIPEKKKVSLLAGIVVVIVVSILLFGGVFAYQYFVIQRVDKTQSSITNTQPSITVLSPNGGETFPYSNTQLHTISWTTSNVSGQYGIHLVIINSAGDTLGTSGMVPSGTSYNWGYSLEPGQYKVKAQVCTIGPSLEAGPTCETVLAEDTSDNYFNITGADKIIWRKYDSGRGFEIRYPEKTEVSTTDITGGTSVVFQIHVDERKRIFEVQVMNIQKCGSASGADTENVKIDNVDFIKYYESRNYSGSVSTSAYKYCAVVGNAAYNLIPRIESSNSFEAESDLIFKEMLSTFRIFR